MRFVAFRKRLYMIKCKEEIKIMMNDKKIENAELNDKELENVSGGVSKNSCGVDEAAVRRPKEELEKSVPQKIIRNRRK